MRVPANGISIYYEVAGPEGAPWLTLSNSLATDLQMWDPQLDVLAENFRVLRYDTRGHGMSESLHGPYSLDLLADDVIALWDALRIKQTHFVGLSLGGMTAQALALKCPERFLSLTIADSRADCPDAYRDFWLQRIAAVENEGVASVVEATLERWFTDACRESQPAMMDGLRKMISGTSGNGYIGCTHAIMGLDFLDQLHRIDLPALFLVGTQDGGTPPEANRAMHEQVKNSQYVEIDPGSHLCNMENSEAFNQVLTGFLADVAG